MHSWRAKTVPKTYLQGRKLPNLKLIALWLTKEPMRRNLDEQGWIDVVTTAHPLIAAAEELAQQFRQTFREKSAAALKVWLVKSAASEIPELERFAAGIERDYDAVSAAVLQPWSNGPVEGQVHRLKLLKRQMYGRGGFSLLRRRVLPFGVQRSQRSP